MAKLFLQAPELLKIDPEAEVKRILAATKELTNYRLARRGAVVATSGGIDSSVTVRIFAEALGAENVIGLMMPEKESSEQTRRLSRLACESAGVRAIEEDITPILEGAGCYRRRDEAVKTIFPNYGPGWRCKIVTPPVLTGDGDGIFTIVAGGPNGEQEEIEPPIEVLRQVVAASNFKQRARKMMEYHYADLHNYAVGGTSNRMETELGFFVKLGDGSGDVKPIAHLYKSQIYQVAEYLGLPDELLTVAPTPDTYPLEHDAEEFFFALPLETLDVCVYCRNNGYTAEQAAEFAGVTVEQARAAYADIAAKRAGAEYLRAAPLYVQELEPEQSKADAEQVVDEREIEKVLSRHESVSEAVVVNHDGGSGSDRLAAYFVPVAGKMVTATDLRKHVREQLPDGSVPRQFVEMESLPLSPDGNIDITSLPTPFTAPRSASGGTVPETDAERYLAGVWQDLLGVESVGINDNFFDLGGHSLLLMRLVGRMERDKGVEVDPMLILHSTLGQIATELG